MRTRIVCIGDYLREKNPFSTNILPHKKGYRIQMGQNHEKTNSRGNVVPFKYFNRPFRGKFGMFTYKNKVDEKPLGCSSKTEHEQP